MTYAQPSPWDAAHPLAASALAAQIGGYTDSSFAAPSIGLPGLVGIGSGAQAPTARQPFNTATVMNAAAAGSDGFVSNAIQGRAVGDFTGVGGTDPGYAFGVNLYSDTGTAANDGNGLTNFSGVLGEASIRSGAAAHIGWVLGGQFEAAFLGSSAGAHVDKMFSLRALAPKYKNGATAPRRVIDGVITGTTTLTSATAAFTSGDTGKKIVGGTNVPLGTTMTYVNATTATLSQACTNGTGLTINIGAGGVADGAYSLWVDAVNPGDVGSIDAYSLWVDGGKSMFKGPLTMIVNAGSNDPLTVLDNTGATTLARVDGGGVVNGLQVRTINNKTQLREDQGGGVFAAVPAVNPMFAADSGFWKLYFRPGTTGGTAKLCAMGAGGTQTVILDTIAS